MNEQERTALAATPAPAPLTDEEIEEVIERCGVDTKFIPHTTRQIARAIERAHGLGQGKEASNG